MNEKNAMVMQLWQGLQSSHLVNGVLPDIEYHRLPWYLRAMQGIAGWIAALFLCIFIGTMFSWLFRYDNEIILLCIGFAACAIAYLLYRSRQHNDFLNQLALAISLCGQMLVAISLLEWFSYKEIWFYVLLGGFQALLTFIMPSFIHRVLSSWFAMVMIFWGLNRLGIYGLGVATAAFALTIMLCNEHRWGKYLSLYEPLAYGLALSLIQFNGYFLFREDWLRLLGKESSTWFLQAAPWIAAAVVAISFLYLIVKLLKQYEIAFTSKAAVVSIGGGVLLGIMGLPVFGVSSALLILLLGYMTQRRVLIALGVVALISFIAWYYYSLSVTLLVKSIILISSGVGLLVARWVVLYFFSAEKRAEARSSHRVNINCQKWVVILVMLLSIGLVNVTIYQKEQILQQGRLVLLELAPLDPRSLMQGDYMRLRFSMQRSAFPGSLEQYDQDGFLVVNLDQHAVARFEGFYQNQALSKNQVKLRYRIRQRNLKLASNAFFFQEGKADLYSQAQYGEFRVAENGDLLLTALRDADFNVLGNNRH